MELLMVRAICWINSTDLSVFWLPSWGHNHLYWILYADNVHYLNSAHLNRALAEKEVQFRQMVGTDTFTRNPDMSQSFMPSDHFITHIFQFADIDWCQPWHCFCYFSSLLPCSDRLPVTWLLASVEPQLKTLPSGGSQVWYPLHCLHSGYFPMYGAHHKMQCRANLALTMVN